MSYNFDKNITVRKLVLLVSSSFLLSFLSHSVQRYYLGIIKKVPIYMVFIIIFTKYLKIPQVNQEQQ
ncbi:hypothetical protein LEP1GSC082_0426 [Leptospira kirschneri str. H2]|nr:hypothetical protein LEP1GSC082_0426 [Leptospira kirschneri str. H2]